MSNKPVVHQIREGTATVEAHVSCSAPIIGILAWEHELEQIPGTIIHPRTFDFPVRIKRVRGAKYESVVVNPESSGIVDGFIAAAQVLEHEGVRAIISTTGLTVLYQRQLVEAVQIPVMTSSMLLLPMIARMLNRRQQVGIITADSRHLGSDHFVAAGVADIPFCVKGMEQTRLLRDFAVRPNPIDALTIYEQEVEQVAQQLIEENDCVGAILIEVTGLCSFSGSLRKRFKLPVFDIVEAANMLWHSFAGCRYTC